MTQYVKLISENQIEQAPLNYTTETGAIIFNFTTDEELMFQYGYKPLTEVVRPTTGRRYKITYTDMTTTIDEVLTYLETQEEYEARIAQEERQRLDNLTLTPADTWRALYKAKGITQEAILNMIEQQMTGIDMNAVKIEFGASKYYRGAKFGNNKLFDVIGNMLGYTPADIDYLFLNKELPEKDEEYI